MKLASRGRTSARMAWRGTAARGVALLVSTAAGTEDATAPRASQPAHPSSWTRRPRLPPSL
eukprot:7211581-Lingulodinium_polyedra.AAC.1